MTDTAHSAHLYHFRHHLRMACSLARSLVEQERGNTLVEMALVLPVFFLLLFGLFSFAIVTFSYGNATYAGRAGARYASVRSSTSLAPSSSASVQSFVTPYLWAAPASGTKVTTIWTPSNTIGSTVTVTVSIQYPIAVPFYSLKNITLRGVAMRTILR